MAEITDAEQVLFDHLQTFATAENLKIRVRGKRYKRDKDETYLMASFLPPVSKRPRAGARTVQHYEGLFQVDIIGPEERRLKAFKLIGERLAEHFWPKASKITPVLSGTVDVAMRKARPVPFEHPAPGEGELAAICEINWSSEF